MVALIVVIGVVLLVAFGFAVSKVNFGNTAAIDKVRRTDPDAAARLELQRAEEGIRGMGQRRF